MHRTQLLQSLHKVGKSPYPLFEMLRCMLRCCRKYSKTKYIDKIFLTSPLLIYLLDKAAIYLIDLAFDNLMCRLHNIGRHTYRACKIVCRTRRDNSEWDIQPLTFHCIDHIIYGAVTSCNHDQVTCFLSIKRILIKRYQPRLQYAINIRKHLDDVLDFACDFTSTSLFVI